MKTKNIIFLVTAAVVIVSLLYSFMGSGDQSAYIEEINKEREEKDRFMKTSKESPFAGNPESYQGLSYYPPDPKYKIIAELTPIERKRLLHSLQIQVKSNDTWSMLLLNLIWMVCITNC